MPKERIHRGKQPYGRIDIWMQNRVLKSVRKWNQTIKGPSSEVTYLIQSASSSCITNWLYIENEMCFLSKSRTTAFSGCANKRKEYVQDIVRRKSRMVYDYLFTRCAHSNLTKKACPSSGTQLHRKMSPFLKLATHVESEYFTPIWFYFSEIMI